MQKEQIISRINGKFAFSRIHALKKLKKEYPDEVNYECGNNVLLNCQSKYSYGPYYPAMTAYLLCRNSAAVCGLTDLLTTCGIKEFVNACKILSLTYITGYREPVTVPFLEKGFLTISVYGIPCNMYKKVDIGLRKDRENKYVYVKNAVRKINEQYKKHKIKLNFEQDIISKSLYYKGGTVANKQVFYALADKIVSVYGKGQPTLDFLINDVKLDLDAQMIEKIKDETNPYYLFDLAKALNDESIFGKRNLKRDVEVTASAHEIGALSVVEIKTKDKNEVYKVADRAKEIGADGVAFTAYAFSESDRDEICKHLVNDKLLAVSLEVFDEPRKTPDNMFGSLYSDNIFKLHAYAIVGHEMSVSISTQDGFNSSKMTEKVPSFEDRVNLFAEIGHKSV